MEKSKRTRTTSTRDDGEKKPKHAKLLKKSEKKTVVDVVEGLDHNEMLEAVSKEISKSVHIYESSQRKLVWDTCMKLPALHNCIKYMTCEYVKLYRSIECTGSDKYMHFYKSWFSLPNDSGDFKDILLSQLKADVTTSIGFEISSDTWNTVVSTMVCFVYNYIQRNVALCIDSLSGNLEEDTCPVLPDVDNVFLIRLCGWALFSCIDYRKRAIQSKTKTKHTTGKIDAFEKELEILNYAVCVDKSDLPTGITAKDRGGLTLPHESLLPFSYSVIQACRSYFSPSVYKKHGKNLIEVSTQPTIFRSDSDLIFTCPILDMYQNFLAKS